MQWLILLVDGTAVETLDATSVRAASGRLVIAEATSADEFTEHPAVLAVTDRVLPEELADELTSSEVMFAAAFASRTKKPERLGDGLPWDATGYEPPDAPHGDHAERGDGVAVERRDDNA